MSRFHILSVILVSGVAVLFAPDLAPGLQASTPQEVTVFNFKVPVQVPGRVLPAGRYLFKLEQSGGELNVVEIKNPEESKVYGVFLVKPDYRGKAPSQPGLTFDKRAHGSPLAIRTWFYPGDKYGNQFMYAK